MMVHERSQPGSTVVSQLLTVVIVQSRGQEVLDTMALPRKVIFVHVDTGFTNLNNIRR